ncbi:MAG: anaerobic ribonucleoside-triphosphate reductase activating protein [Alphaproteobacteria bacterium]|nr:anaerobic ribonucleoside-triphosphate reductase activating protein [Alphaproteobacteria bacterium]
MSVTIGGVEPFTTVDFPGRLAAVLFCLGCPLRCPYCHNRELQDFKGKPFISWDRFTEFLESRKKLLDGVVFSGGEPLAQPDLYESIKTVKDMGFAIGLHTSGINADRLKQILPLLTWIGFDIKTVFEAYEERIPHANAATIEACLDMAIAAGIELEVRTTLDPRIISKEELLQLAAVLAQKGIETYAIQEYRPHPAEKQPPALNAVTSFFTDKALLDELNSLFKKFIIRRA